MSSYSPVTSMLSDMFSSCSTYALMLSNVIDHWHLQYFGFSTHLGAVERHRRSRLSQHVTIGSEFSGQLRPGKLLIKFFGKRSVGNLVLMASPPHIVTDDNVGNVAKRACRVTYGDKSPEREQDTHTPQHVVGLSRKQPKAACCCDGRAKQLDDDFFGGEESIEHIFFSSPLVIATEAPKPKVRFLITKIQIRRYSTTSVSV